MKSLIGITKKTNDDPLTMFILQVGRGGFPAAVLASPFRPIGQERSPKTAPQHLPTVGGNIENKNQFT